MSTPAAPVASVAERIAAIEARFDSGGTTGAGAPVLGTHAEFDAFGSVYQDAVEAAERARGTLTPATASGLTGTLTTAGYRPLASYAPQPASSAGGPTASQISAAINGIAGAPGQRPIGGYGSMPVPVELASYPNGQLPEYALQRLTTQPNHRLAAPAAAAWDSLVAAAAADGITLRITDSYRPYAEQVDLAERKGLYSQGGLAARPGTSNHGWGLAVDADVTDPATLNWLRVNGPRFGFVEAAPREPWHWEFRPHQV